MQLNIERKCSVLTLTPQATDAIEGILTASSAPDGAGIRISPGAPTNSSGAGENDLQVAVVEGPAGSDEVIQEAGARVFVEDTVADYLSDKQLDAQVVEGRVGFMIGEQSS